MDRRTAVQALIAVIAGAMDPEQKTTPTKTPTLKSSTDHFFVPSDLGAPRSLLIYLNWKDITIHRGDETVTLDQEELFRALKEAKHGD